MSEHRLGCRSCGVGVLIKPDLRGVMSHAAQGLRR